MDTLTSMRVFAQVVEGRSFSAAARRLKLSQAMVTRHIQHLEHRVGARLLNRTSREFSLTEAGATYHEHCVEMLNNLREAEAELQSLTRSPKGALRISTSPAFAASALMPILRDFSRAHPRIAIELVATTRLAKLVDEQFDIAIRLTDRNTDSSLISRKVANSGFTICAAPAYLEEAGRPKTIDETKTHRWLAYSAGVWVKGIPLLVDGQIDLVTQSYCLLSDDYRLVVDAALAGHGIAALPFFAAGTHIRDGHLIVLFPDIEIPPVGIHVVYPSRDLLPAKTRAFIDFFVSRFPKGADHDPWREHANAS
jgi:DNA-binding transcriptional LysR family regulator